MNLPPALLKELTAHALEDYPSECCGFILQSSSGGLRTLRMKNVQDEYHRRFPGEFPRTSRTAYWMDPAALLKLHKDLRSAEERVLAIYHSHPEGSTEFSEEDRRQALWSGEPVFPDISYLVLSIQQKKFSGSALYRWNPNQKAFLECADL